MHCGFDITEMQPAAQKALVFNPLPDMPILGSSNSAAIKEMMSKK